MWEALSSILTSNNVIQLGVIILLILLAISLLAKMGLMSLRFKGLSMGNGDKERDIIRHQIDFAESACTEFYVRLERKEGFDEWRAKYITEKCFDEFIYFIVYNHLSSDEIYIALRQADIWKTLQENITVDDNPYYRSEEFRKLVYDAVEGVIKKLFKIKEFHNNKWL